MSNYIARKGPAVLSQIWADGPTISPDSTNTEDKSRKEAIVPFVPIFVEEADVIQGAKELLKVIRPTWDLSHVEFKIRVVPQIEDRYPAQNAMVMTTLYSFTDGITNKLVGCFHKEISKLSDENGGSYIPIKTQGLSPVQAEDPVIIEKEDDDQYTDDRATDDGSPVQYSDDVVLVRIYGNKTDLLIDRKAETQNFLLLHTYGLAPSLYATFKNGLVYEYVPGTTLNTDSVLCPEIWPLVARRMAEMHRKVRKVKETFLPIGRLREEFNKLYEYLEALDSPIVFSHNDLLLGNVIYTQSLNTVNFIDYEYADYNFQAFDIGNHFAEMCGVDEVDYSRYPKREFQLQWLRVYLEEYLQRSHIQNDEVELLYVQVNQFALASHIFWTVWSLLQAEHSTIDFDYVGYAFLRYNEYLARKVEFLSLTAAKNNK
ncbi:GM13416 [Drosophila sechellia]|uniref:ethanolamine kinase n=1 Tax=Drosophila sechellia TaxID=7238 RepID=B4IF44_DROSE|nr:GM13416 [Drosophila sechellia]